MPRSGNTFLFTFYKSNRYIFLFLLIGIAACSPARRLAEDEALLKKNHIRGEKKEFHSEMKSVLKQKPNRKILGLFRFHLGMYNLADRGKETKFKNYIKNTIGEPPVILDKSLTERSSSQLEQLLRNRGYFNANVTDSTIIKRKRAYVTYTVYAGMPYRINKVYYQASDQEMSNILWSEKPNSLIVEGHVFNVDTLQKERDRFSNEMRNRGYYTFSREFMFAKIDSTLNSHQVDIYFGVYDPLETPGVDSSKVTRPKHTQYVLQNVYVRTDHDPNKGNQQTPGDTVFYKGYAVISSDPVKTYSPVILIQNIFMKPGDLFRLKNLEQTYRRLSGLGVFRFINVSFEETLPDSGGFARINCFIALTPQLRQSATIETEGTHSGGNLGISGNLAYRNKNTFHGAELLELKLKGGLEAQRSFADTTDQDQKLFFFNTIEFGPELNLTFQKLLIPFIEVDGISKQANPSTTVTAAYNYQQRPDYTRKISNLSFGYAFREGSTKRHWLYPIDLNIVQVELDTAFKNRIDALNDKGLANSYSSHATFAARYSFQFSNQNLNTTKNFSFLRTNLESSGNTLSLFNNLLNQQSDEENNYKIFGVKYSQYVRADVDYRYYHVIDFRNTIVYRINAGVGLPYGNSDVLPFEKSFFGGGANDIRAWKARTLGPGAYSEVLSFEQTGDLKLEANLEYRFDLIDLMKGALFIDAGNIWLLRNDLSRPGAEFKSSSFLREIAVGTGIGFRFDFGYFVLRLDAAIKANDPSELAGSRWVLPAQRFKDINYNIGIGYPF